MKGIKMSKVKLLSEKELEGLPRMVREVYVAAVGGVSGGEGDAYPIQVRVRRDIRACLEVLKDRTGRSLSSMCDAIVSENVWPMVKQIEGLGGPLGDGLSKAIMARITELTEESEGTH